MTPRSFWVKSWYGQLELGVAAGGADDDHVAAPVEHLEGVEGDLGPGHHVVDPVDATGAERAVELALLERDEGADLVDDVVGAAVEEVGGAELPGQRLLLRVDVDGDDAARPLHPQGLEGVEAHAAAAVHDGGLADLDVGAVHHRAGAGHHAAADEAGRGERHVLRDGDGLDGLDHRALGEHRRAGEVPALLAVEGERLWSCCRGSGGSGWACRHRRPCTCRRRRGWR